MAIQDSYDVQQTGRAASECRNNYVWIAHANGEWTNYSQLAKGSVTGLAKLAVPDEKASIGGGGFLLDNDQGKPERNPRFCGVVGSAVAKALRTRRAHAVESASAFLH